MRHYENLEQAMCKELDRLDKKYANDLPEMSVQDVEKADVLYHALKSATTYHAMKDADEWEDKDASGRGYRRGRDSMGRYTSGGGYPGYGYSGSPEWMPPYYPRY